MATLSYDSNSTPRWPVGKRNMSSPASSSRLPRSKNHLTQSLTHSRSRSVDTLHPSSARPILPSSTSANTRPNKTTRIMSSVRKSLFTSHPSPQKRALPFDVNTTGMYSTPAERTTSQFRRRGPPPSVEQIAMGLHISRTPYLRSSSAPTYPYPQRTLVSIPLPPPPSRSAMKKTGKTSSSVPSLDPPASSMTVTSSNLSIPRSNGSLFSRMSRLLPGSRTSSANSSMMASPTPSPSDSTTDIVPPKKAVRFSTSTLDLKDRED